MKIIFYDLLYLFANISYRGSLSRKKYIIQNIKPTSNSRESVCTRVVYQLTSKGRRREKSGKGASLGKGGIERDEEGRACYLGMESRAAFIIYAGSRQISYCSQ